jgi:glycerate-2-kinase
MQLMALTLSDVIGDPLDVIVSVPTAQDNATPSPRLRRRWEIWNENELYAARRE